MSAAGGIIAANVASQALNGIWGIGATALSNKLAEEREKVARKENFMYGEMAADAADKRTRSLYGDFYSPSAQLKQIREAGLSPSLLASEGAGAGGAGQSGSQGTGAAGISPNVYGFDPMMIANIKKLDAETRLIKEETNTQKEETKIKEIENSLKSIEFDLYSIDYNALTEYVAKSNGEKISLYEFAADCTSYENFISRLRQMKAPDNLINTEQGQKSLRAIFMARRQFATEIATLSEEETSANFQQSIVNELRKNEFAKLNAQEAIQQLKTNISTNELTESQKDAWNDLLNKLESKSTTLKDIAIILGMIVTQFGGKFNANINTQNKNLTLKR